MLPYLYNLMHYAQQHHTTHNTGVFSMDGDIAPLKEIVALAKKHNAITFIDECHATGFLGPTGRGTDEHCGVLGEIDIINSTLGKALGGGTGVLRGWGDVATTRALYVIVKRGLRNT